MKRRITVFVVALAAVFASATPAQAAQRPHTTSFIAFMNGHNEVPAADSDATGVALFSLKSNRQLCWVIVTHKVDGTLTAAHIHAGAAGTNGPVVVPLSLWPGCTKLSATVAGALRYHPGAFYANVHSTAFPAGAIRGQLMKAGSSH
jgi:CHRD domain-containing protein